MAVIGLCQQRLKGHLPAQPLHRCRAGMLACHGCCQRGRCCCHLWLQLRWYRGSLLLLLLLLLLLRLLRLLRLLL